MLAEKTARGVIGSIGLSKRGEHGKVLHECDLSLLTETGSLGLFFNDLDDSASLPKWDMQRYPAMVELITQCHLAGLPVILGYDSAAEGAYGGELRSIEVEVDRPQGSKDGVSRVYHVVLKGKDMNSGSFQFSIAPPSTAGTSTLVLDWPLTRLSGALSAALARGTGMRVTVEKPGTTSPSAAAISVYAD